MNTWAFDTSAPRVPLWFWYAAALGVAWNLYGLGQFAATFTAAGQAAMTAGMTPARASTYLSLPAWTRVAFAAGVGGGLLGSLALLRRRRGARGILTASLAGYVLLFAADVYYGVFEAVAGQLAILTVVVLIAGALRTTAALAARDGWLR